MNYLISTFGCYVFDKEFVQVCPHVKYEISNESSPFLVAPESSPPFILNFNNPSKNVLKVKFKSDNYFFLFKEGSSNFFSTSFKYNNNKVDVVISSMLCISVDGELICEKNVENLKFSHFEVFQNLCLIVFEGERNFIVVLKDKQVLFCEYYDECNSKDDEKYFLTKLQDSLNHGLVFEIKKNETSKYLVYLDDEELKLKQPFVAMVFLDCVKAGNFKYCNELLDENIKLSAPENIKEFMPEFDYYYPISYNTMILIKKNTLAGIYTFEIENCKISNIEESL